MIKVRRSFDFYVLILICMFIVTSGCLRFSAEKEKNGISNYPYDTSKKYSDVSQKTIVEQAFSKLGTIDTRPRAYLVRDSNSTEYDQYVLKVLRRDTNKQLIKLTVKEAKDAGSWAIFLPSLKIKKLKVQLMDPTEPDDVLWARSFNIQQKKEMIIEMN